MGNNHKSNIQMRLLSLNLSRRNIHMNLRYLLTFSFFGIMSKLHHTSLELKIFKKFIGSYTNNKSKQYFVV